MNPLAWVLPDGPGRHRVCGRECQDGTACQNMVDRVGEPCHLDSHRPEDPRVDDGPTDPDEVPLSGASEGAVQFAVVVGKGLTAALAAFLGLGYFLGDTLIHLGGILTAFTLALALDAYQRRAIADDEQPVEN